MANFAARFCERYAVRPEDYADAMFRRCLHRRAWPFVPLLRLFDADFFLPDYELIRNVGRLNYAHTWHEDVAEFQSHPKNAEFLRRRLRLRVSARRVSRLVNRLLPERKVEASAAEASESEGADEVPPKLGPPLFGQ